MVAQPARVPASIEPLVQFVENTDPSQILPETLAKLKSGVSTRDILAAAALAVARSSDLPPGHHGGPVHPLSGLHAVHNLAARLSGSGEIQYVPVLQSVALANRHIHHPAMGPYILPEMEPMDVTGLPESAYVGGTPGRYLGDSVEGDRLIDLTKQSFLQARGFSALSERHFLWLLSRVSRDELLDLILQIALPKNLIDDHNFLFPMFTWRAIEWLGWEYAPVAMRPAIRYVARPPVPPKLDEFEAVIAEYGLLDRTLREATGPDETAAVGQLSAQLGAMVDYSTLPGLIGRALADGLSLEGAGEALSIGAAVLYLRSQLGNPMDVHLHTGANNRRYLVRPGSGISRRLQLLGLMTWHTGPEVRNTQATIAELPDPDRERVAVLPHRDQGALLDALTESIHDQPRIDLRTVGNIGRLMAKPEVQNTVALAQQYANLGYDPRAYFVRLGEIACRDNFTEMHAYKHHQAAYEEYQNTRAEYRWVHLVSAAKAAAISFGKMVNIYEEVREILPV